MNLYFMYYLFYCCYIVDDYYVQLGMEANWILNHPDLFNNNETLQILANTRSVRFCKIAWCVQARKEMLKVINSSTQFKWDPFTVDRDSCETAINILNMTDVYTIILSEVSKGMDPFQSKLYGSNNKKQYNPSNIVDDGGSGKLQIFHAFIINLIVQYANRDNDFHTSSKYITGKLHSKTRFKDFDNLTHIQLVAETMKGYGILNIKESMNQIESNLNDTDNEVLKNEMGMKKKKRGGKTKWGKFLERRKLSTINADDKMKKGIVRYLKRHGIDLNYWCLAWGMQEFKKVQGWVDLK